MNETRCQQTRGNQSTKLCQETDDKILVVHSFLPLLSGQFEGNSDLQFANIVSPLTHQPVSVLLDAITCQVLIRVTITKYCIGVFSIFWIILNVQYGMNPIIQLLGHESLCSQPNTQQYCFLQPGEVLCLALIGRSTSHVL